MDYQKKLNDFSHSHDYFIGIDSDGCVFDSMEVKQKEFFIPIALKYFNLFPVSKIIRETWEFVNLYSIYRGGNRFISLLKVFELLSMRIEIKESGIQLPDLSPLNEWTRNETRLGNATLRRHYEETKDKRLGIILEWSETVNREISEWLHGIPPFLNARKAIEKMSSLADILVVSQTPLEALEYEWITSDLKRFAGMIAAQEHGSKTEHLSLAAKSKYPDNKILMIGDAKGDLDAALNNGVLFYPIIPGREENSWEKFTHEALERFATGTYKGRYEESLIEDFRKSLPDTPAWEARQTGK